MIHTIGFQSCESYDKCFISLDFYQLLLREIPNSAVLSHIVSWMTTSFFISYLKLRISRTELL